MKIIHIEDYFNPEAGYQVNELLRVSDYYFDETFLITSKDMSPFHISLDEEADKKFEEETNVKIYRLKPLIKISTRLVLKDMRKIIREIEPDIVYMHGIGDFKDLILLEPKKKYRIVRDCHMSWVASKNKFRKVFYFFYKHIFAPIVNNTDKYETIYALGDEEYEYLKAIGIKDKKIEFLRHGYNDSVMYYNEEERIATRKKYGINDNDIIVSYIGKFNFAKRPDLIFDIIDYFDENFININRIKLLFIGHKDEDYLDYFMEKANQLTDKIDIIIDDAKPFTELRKYYSASDICIFPRETTLSSIHSQVCGCPVIMEKHDSNIERVVNQNNLFPIDGLKEASDILYRIIEEKEYLKSKTEIFAEQLLDREYKKQMERIYEKLNDNKII